MFLECSICGQVHRPSSAEYWGRGGVWLNDPRNGNHRPISLDSLDCRAPLLLVEGCQTAAWHPLLSDRIRNFLLRFPDALSFYLWQPRDIPELRKQCVHVASGGNTFQASASPITDATQGRSASRMKTGTFWISEVTRMF